MVTWLVASLVLSAGIGPDTLEAVDLYGLRTIREEHVRAAIRLAAGDPTPESVQPIRARLLAISGVADVDVSVVCCGENGGSLLYVGIREAGAPPLALRSAPSGNAMLPREVVERGARFHAALRDAVQRGATTEDASRGYAWSADPALRATQEEFVDIARADFAMLTAVLRTSADATHRALAAQILAYGTDRTAIVAELVHAIDDPSESVRNNAARALALLAQWAGENQPAGFAVPVEPFIELLNAVSWTDRNKGVMVLVPLTADRQGGVLAELRTRALPALVEMARWSNPGHAIGPYILLARVAGLEDGAAFEAWQGGEREAIIARAQAVAHSSDTIHVAPPTGDDARDRANIQAAFDAAHPGVTIRFAPGLYRLGAGARLTVPDVTILGHPDGTVLRGCDPDRFRVAPEQYRTVVFGCTGFLVQTERQTIRDLTFEYAWHAIVIGPYPTSEAEQTALMEGGQQPTTYPSGGHRIERNTFRALPNGLRALGVGADTSIVRDNDFIDVFHAIGIYGSPLHFVGNRITVEQPARVPFSWHPGSAVIISPGITDCAGHLVAENQIAGNPGAIFVIADRGTRCHGVTIRDNVIAVERVKVPEAWLGAEPTATDSTMVDVPISLLRTALGMPGMTDTTTEAVLENILVQGNRVTGADGIGILVDGSNNRIEGNTVAGIRRREPFPGITWIGSEAVLWEAANGSGIWVSPGSIGNRITGNTFRNVAGPSIVVEGEGTVVELGDPKDTVRDLGRGTRVTRRVERP